MFGETKKDLVKGLGHVRNRLCVYGVDSTFCDCKYGISGDSHKHGGEKNGCPEVRMASALINAMTDKEFARICKRAKIF